MSTTPDKPPVVVLLGFHRSGTSMVTRMLNLLGVGLGDESALLPPEDRDNARGYWEPRWMIELNEELLATLGSGTFEPFAAEPGWERSPQLEPLRERARTLLAQHFEGETRWGWKDPRTSLTLPFWREVVGQPFACVVCVRSPADAVASALRRGVVDIHRWQYGERWTDYTTLALAGTAPDERTLVFYEDVLRDPAAEAQRLAAFLGVGAPSEQQLEAVVASVDPALRHHMSSAWDVAVDPGLPIGARVLYLLLRASRTLGEPAQAAAERLPEALERVGAELRDARQTRRQADEEHQRTLLQLDELRAATATETARLEAARREHAETLAASEARVAELEGTLAQHERAIAERDDAIAILTGSRSWRLTRPLRAAGDLVRGRR
jgi:hypothetical protein